MISTEQKASFRELFIILSLIHFCFILLTPMLLQNLYLARLGPLAYLSVLVCTGFISAKKMRQPALYAFLAGCLSQTPGIISSLVVIVEILSKYEMPDAFDFAAQVWQTPFAPLFPLLPRIRLIDVPFYYWVTLLLSFVLPLFPASGAFINCKLPNQRVKN